jgi:hypothetical protein
MIKITILKSILIIAASVLVLASCDKIDAPYIVPNTDPIEPEDTAACPVPKFPAVTAHYKRALIEDYTGHTCVNCPRAALITHDLKDKYQDSLVVVAVHAGFYAKPSTSDSVWAYDFRTPAGTEWDNFFKVGAVGNPNGMVSRKGYPNNQQVLSPPSWANAVKNTVSEAPLMDLQLITEYDSAKDKLCIHSKISFLQAFTERTLKISVIITEDSIIQAQKNNDVTVGTTPSILNYVHTHVMRGAVNGIWGTPVLLIPENSSFAPVVTTFQTHFTNFNLNTMVPKNCHVIAFVFDAETKEVLQVAEVQVVE